MPSFDRVDFSLRGSTFLTTFFHLFSTSLILLNQKPCLKTSCFVSCFGEKLLPLRCLLITHPPCFSSSSIAAAGIESCISETLKHRKVCGKIRGTRKILESFAEKRSVALHFWWSFSRDGWVPSPIRALTSMHHRLPWNDRFPSLEREPPNNHWLKKNLIMEGRMGGKV